ncbi:MAG: peptidoglycan bridge formation glycyltransferase FemA/FemB family protein [Spirochaetaceae bacterium]|nr:peptidoglycan bridge formation glycyltransferase FemA/FemB family protein [Spirochaetaceae bacterium]
MLTINEEPNFDGDNFLQTPFWQQFKGKFGWQGKTFTAAYDNLNFSFLVLNRQIGRLFNFIYLPLPNFTPITTNHSHFLKELSKLLKKYYRNPLIIRYDLTWENNIILTNPLRKAIMPVQPPDTVIINLQQSNEELLKNMHKKTRYNVGLAAKKGVTIRQDNNQIEQWYTMYQETAQRDGIAIHSYNYYQTFLQLAKENGLEARLYLAEHEGDLLAGIITLFYKDTATYVYGASSNLKRNLMASYGLQWQAMSDAKAFGCTAYDLFGIPPSDDPNHPMFGLYQFKTGFGGQLVHRLGAYDYPVNWPLYTAFRLAEKGRLAKKELAKKRK